MAAAGVPAGGTAGGAAGVPAGGAAGVPAGGAAGELAGRLAGEKVCLRTLGPDDLEYLYFWENNPAVWQYGDCGAETSHTTGVCPVRFTREELRRFIENQQQGIRANEQLRFVICRREGGPVGFIDLFDFDADRLRAGVGILICDTADRRKGYGREALRLVSDYARSVSGLRELWCSVEADNRASIALFSAAGFECVECASTEEECDGDKKTLDFRQELAPLSLSQHR